MPKMKALKLSRYQKDSRKRYIRSGKFSVLPLADKKQMSLISQEIQNDKSPVEFV